METDFSKVNTVNEDVNPSPSSISLNESPKKCNLLFSFNFDLNVVNTDDSTDSDNADLQIDVSEIDNYEPSSKHKREMVEETCSVINEMEEEIERQLDAKAAKTNLTATNVKNILKHVITNEHVMAMVQKRLYDTDDDMLFEPKLTRAKAKELAAAQVNIPWPITPLKKSTSEVQVLIEQELPEDSSDEEYNPEQDKQSDDDREPENLTNSDVESQPPTFAYLHDSTVIEQPKSPSIQYDSDGIFKIPGIPHVPTEEESIGQRTRSKLCLSETSLEQIEQAFIPPDITTDMYDWDGEIDEDWDNFLKEFTQPLTQEPTAEDDPEADPEYNILEDEETDFLDKEELRADKAVKVTRKELNTLFAELFEYTDTFSNEEQEISRKKKSSENSNLPVENNSLNCSMLELLPVWTEPEHPKLFTTEQRHLLAIQLRQHVQLMAQHFAVTFMHPDLSSQSKICKQNLQSLKYLSNGSNSAFNAENLPDALKLVSDWEEKFLDEIFAKNYKQTIIDEGVVKNIYTTNKWKYTPKFHPELKKLFVESKALMYPQLLPEMPFKSELNKYTRTPHLKSEENLIALGLEQFLPFIASKPRKFKSKKLQLMDATQLIIQYLLPCREPQKVLCHIQRRRCAKEPNPIKYYYEKGCAPRTIHYITLECDLRAPKDQPINLLPLRWQTYLNFEQKIDGLKRKHILNSYNDVRKNGNSLGSSKSSVLPRILPMNISPKTSTSNNTPKSDSVTQNTETLNKTSYSNDSYRSNTEANFCEMEDKETMGNGTSNAVNEEKEKERNENLKETKAVSSNVTTKSSKFSKKSELVELPQLRKTTPRLAKTRSAQNMKLMAQVLGPKGLSSNCNGLKSREKNELNRDSEKTLILPKVDNEDEIAELMLASTTIKKDSVSRKKAKKARELENIKRLLESENPLNEEERESKFAASYLQKLHQTLESTSPETFRSIIKLYLDYNEKMDNIHQLENELSFSGAAMSSKSEEDKDAITIGLYRDVCEKLRGYPELCTDFLLFLKPHQAMMIDKSVEYTMLQKMSEFINVTQIYFAKQPSRIAKMMQAITQLSSDPDTILETVNTVMGPILKGHPLVMDLFLQILPTAKPPESLFAPQMFENLTCPLGPHDKYKVYADNAPELYENIDLPILSSQEDPYGGENCKCTCHNGDKNLSEHCVSCGTRFLNGRIYLQTSEGLRPAKVIFPGADEEKFENISRVSLKMTDKLVVPTPSKRRRKSTKNENVELCQKDDATKISPVKSSEEDSATVNSRKTIKSIPKLGDEKKAIKRLCSDEYTVNNKRMRVTHHKSKRKIEREELKDGEIKPNESASENCKSSFNEIVEKHVLNVGPEVGGNLSKSKNESEKVTSDGNLKVQETVKPWTRQEDMILLQNIKKEYSENSFVAVSKILGDRTVDEVKERCQILLTLLEKMT